MHLLSARNRDEFLATPELVRFVLADGKNGPEPTLLIKASTLSLKYLIRLKRFRLLLFRVQTECVGYGIQLDEDPDYQGTVWSLFEYPDEVAGALGLAKNSKCTVFLFNELALNVAWGEAEIDLSGKAATHLLGGLKLRSLGDARDVLDDVSAAINGLREGTTAPAEGLLLDWSAVPEWHPITNHYVTNRAEASLISIFETDEGRQQEALAHWLVDSLHPAGAVHSPQIHEESKVRELSDILLSYENGCFLIESKTLAIWVRDDLPSRKKLAIAVGKHLNKAVGQLAGGVKNLRRGLRVTDVQGNHVKVTHAPPPHVIVLVPDLNLLWDASEFGGDFFKQACIKCGGYFHILDPAELLRIVQAAEMIAARDKSTTPMMALDYYLIERAKTSWIQATPDFNVLLRFEDER